ncbi:MAG: lasso RiPP family leader peptide-containing protein [Candidatus Hydrogenedentales bacterium]
MKKRYHKPMLIVRGSVSDLTLQPPPGSPSLP